MANKNVGNSKAKAELGVDTKESNFTNNNLYLSTFLQALTSHQFERKEKKVSRQLKRTLISLCFVRVWVRFRLHSPCVYLFTMNKYDTWLFYTNKTKQNKNRFSYTKERRKKNIFTNAQNGNVNMLMKTNWIYAKPVANPFYTNHRTIETVECKTKTKTKTIQ